MSSGTLKGKRNLSTFKSDKSDSFLLLITAFALISFNDFTKNVLSEITELVSFNL